MAGVKDGNLVARHGSLQAGALDNRPPSVRGSQRAGCVPRPFFGRVADQPENPGA